MGSTSGYRHRLTENKMKFSEIDCPVCAANDYRVIFPDTLGQNPPVFGYKWTPEIRRTYRVIRCKVCGHGYCSPRLQEMYSYYCDVMDEGYLENAPLRTESANRVLGKIREYIPSGTLLDVGCGTGDFLQVAKKSFQAEGLEVSNWALHESRKKGLTVHKKILSEFCEGRKTLYDIVTLWGVIEHLENPLPDMQRINRLLRENGLVCLWTGDLDSWLAKLLGHRWWYILGQHIQYFSRHSLDALMQRSGFQREFSGIYPYVISCGYLGVRLCPYRFVGPVFKSILGHRLLNKRIFTLYLPSEIFGIYRKVRNL